MTEQHISLSQFCDLLALDPAAVRFVTFGPRDSSVSIYIEDDNDMAKKMHPGFAGASKSIAAREDVSMDSARRILAAATRRASPAAKAANPRLNRVPTKRGK